MSEKFLSKAGSFLIDVGCLLTPVTFWARYVEPRLLCTTRLKVSLPGLKGLKIIHLTDLHFHAKTPSHLLQKIVRRVKREKASLIVFTGDFICYSHLEQKKRLEEFLNAFEAPLGCFCTLGNHDYASYVSRDCSGDYVPLKRVNPLKGFLKGLKNFFYKTKRGEHSAEAREVALHEELVELLRRTPFTLLENATQVLSVGLNVVGLGDYALGRCCPGQAFRGYNAAYPGIILSHNPDTLPLLAPYPGEWILSGHTHGEQIHFPYPPFMRKLSQRLTRLENITYTRGLYQVGQKQLYVNRGLGCHKPVRLFSPPEMLVLECV